VNIDYIFSCPSATEFDLLDPQAQAVIISLGSEWPSYPMVGTKEVNGRKLLHVRMTELLSTLQLSDLFTYFNLDWQVFSIRSAYSIMEVINGITTYNHVSYYLVDKSIFLSYINDVYIDEITQRPVTLEDIIYLSAYAGTIPANF